MIKRFSFFVVLTGFIAILSGCAQSQSSSSKSATQDLIRVWHWMSDREEAFVELGKRYESQTGIKVKFELYAPSEAYQQRIKAAAQTNTLPDIFGVLGEKRDFASFIRSGYVSNLQVDMEANDDQWKKSFFDKAVAVNTFDSGNEYEVPAGIYGAPLDVMTIQMVYNKALYKKAGLDPEKAPSTWAEFVADAKILRDNNIKGFVSGFGEIWLIDAFCSNLAMNLMGQQKVFDTYSGKVPYTDPQWIEVLGCFKQMADEKIILDGAVTMVNKSAEQTFANERAAYSFNGSWCINVYKGMNPELDYAAMPVPKLSEANPMLVWGGAGSSFVINEKSGNKDKAVAFLKWLTDATQQAYLSQATENLPSNKNALAEIPGVLAQFADDMDSTTHPSLYPTHEDPAVSEALLKGIQSILIGEKSPQEIAQYVQKTKEKQMSKQS